MEQIIQTDNVNKKIGNKQIIDRVSMTVNKGDIYGLVGKNGAGKTTLMRMILSMLAPDQGSIHIPEDLIRKKRIGALIENPAFYPYMTVRENLEYYRILKGISDQTCVDQTIEEIGLKDACHKKFKHLSLGMKQRLGIGLALLGDPELLILDEPINGLDPEGIREIRELILKKHRTSHTTILISSHILTELSQMANRFGILDQGRMIKEITAEDMERETPNEIYVEVDDGERAVRGIKELNREIAVRRIDANKLMIEGQDCTVGNISQLLIRHEVRVDEIRRNTVSLEEYFIDLIRKEA